MFTIHLVLDEPGRPDLYHQWFEFYFPGQDRFTIWNTEIVTARKAFWDATHELAYFQTMAMLTPEEIATLCNLEFEPANFSTTGKVLGYRLIERKQLCFEKFNGLTFFEQLEKTESDIIRKTPPTIYETFQIDKNFGYGIGLFIILDVDLIDRSAIEQAINQFRLINEADWQSAIPVPRERLPEISKNEALAAI